MSEQITSYPLSWPIGFKRSSQRLDSRFTNTPEKAQQFLRKQLGMISATDIVISSNASLRKDGYMYSEMANDIIVDPGVAVYFKRKGIDVVLCCDTYKRVWENVHAIAKTIDNLRAVDRYGVSDFLARSFTGFNALPPATIVPYKRNWWEVLGVDKDASVELIASAYKIKAKKLHPDMGGNAVDFDELKKAYEEALK